MLPARSVGGGAFNVTDPLILSSFTTYLPYASEENPQPAKSEIFGDLASGVIMPSGLRAAGGCLSPFRHDGFRTGPSGAGDT